MGLLESAPTGPTPTKRPLVRGGCLVPARVLRNVRCGAPPTQARALQRFVRWRRAREQVVMGSTWTEEQARATLKPFLLEANLELMTSKVAKKHMEEKLGVKVSKGDESKAFAKLCLSITTEILKKRKAAAALPPDSSEDEARPADSSEDEKAKKPAPAKKKSKPASPVAADERPEWVRPTKGPRDTDDSEVSDDEPPAKPVATKKARQASEKKARPRAKAKKTKARAGDSSDEDDSSGSEIMSGDEVVIGAGGAAGALYVPLAKQRAPRATTSRFAEGRPTKKAMQPLPEPEPEP